ncbi:MAG: hypothetical protein A3G75_12880 [Verrucomicrobia bacterium RIFCSPLOWO2_12_FULL_64_8]|nr:MAG: hypothetical protein A3G75_12880 [Verrucomicrobia bacterium RIFCSPLOWO2_12_FULL_64_8]
MLAALTFVALPFLEVKRIEATATLVIPAVSLIVLRALRAGNFSRAAAVSIVTVTPATVRCTGFRWILLWNGLPGRRSHLCNGDSRRIFRLGAIVTRAAPPGLLGRDILRSRSIGGIAHVRFSGREVVARVLRLIHWD